ncbi:MAG: methylated-DNA--[protein]-cysteine S-methyltransferase [Candidatus Omnitrophica bacterium]|nr:methylated-DNA--[protein]-cysteine S-methyltransferase [Candidatus Omnitrophota bacterium]
MRKGSPRQKGTPFQQRVWRRIAQIPYGQTLTYSALAREIGQPRAARAVARAAASNRLPLLIPCHRVVGKRAMGGYAWGAGLKRRLLDLERGAAPASGDIMNPHAGTKTK